MSSCHIFLGSSSIVAYVDMLLLSVQIDSHRAQFSSLIQLRWVCEKIEAFLEIIETNQYLSAIHLLPLKVCWKNGQLIMKAFDVT